MILNCFIIYFMLVSNSFVRICLLYIFNLTNYFSLQFVLQLLQLKKKQKKKTQNLGWICVLWPFYGLAHEIDSSSIMMYMHVYVCYEHFLVCAKMQCLFISKLFFYIDWEGPPSFKVDQSVMQPHLCEQSVQ